MSKRMVDIEPGTDRRQLEDGSWTATFRPLQVTVSAADEEQLKKNLVQAIMETMKGSQEAQEAFAAYAEDHSEVVEEDQGPLERAKAATAGFAALGSDTFDAYVAADDVPVLVDFWAEWCQPCHMLAPVLKELSDDLAGRMRVAKLNIDDHQEVAQRYNVRSIPTLILFSKGHEVARVSGAGRPKDEYRREIEPHLPAGPG
ncbi:MAG TPA: thioredoxin [Actinomycetota bacterium]|nr:thioredoxin [Actinomycetota bacterium]